VKVLHTSDWHIGRLLYSRSRYAEFSAFLDWLAETIDREQVELLLVAGDLFDTGTPSNRAQQLYYQFLCRVAGSCCRHIVVIAGNHDSPTFLDAPKALLKALSVHVVGSASDTPSDEVLVLDDAHGDPAIIVGAVPYLRDRNIRKVEAGESVSDKEMRLIEGIGRHYAAVGKAAENARAEIKAASGVDLPIIMMGHLFTAGGQTMDGDGVRDLYVGSLAHVTVDLFPACTDYLALGHLHVPQTVGKSEHKRYSGSPIPIGFGEAKQQKTVAIVEINHAGETPKITLIEVPRFQALARIKGDWESIASMIDQLVSCNKNIWLEITYEGKEMLTDLSERLDAAIMDSPLEILAVKNSHIVQRVLGQMYDEETLDDLDIDQVFTRCMDAHEIPETQRDSLQQTYHELVTTMQEADLRAE